MEAAEVNGRNVEMFNDSVMKIWGVESTQFVFWLSMFSGLFPEKEKGEKVTYVVYIYIYLIYT